MAKMQQPQAVPGLPRNWGATADDIAYPWPCDGMLDPPFTTLWRALPVEAPVATTFRWVCQTKVAPYSYDWLDNPARPRLRLRRHLVSPDGDSFLWFRRSPRELTPGAGNLAIGQKWQPFVITDFETDVHITGRGTPGATRIFGPLAGTYLVRPHEADDDKSRLVVRLDVGGHGVFSALRRRFLSWGDLVMMRKQLLTLKALAERQHAASQGAG